MSVASCVGLLRLTSPALPVGAFAFSRGLEGAVDAKLVHDEASAGDWILGVLEHALCPLDGALLLRLHAAWSANDQARVRELALALHAFRETHELAFEDAQMGAALCRLLSGLGVEDARMDDSGPEHASYAAMFALAAVRWSIASQDTLAGYFWAFCEGQVGAALRLLPIGQSSGQRILERAIPVIERAVETASMLEDDDIGSFAPGLAWASARHESQYSRLFRS